MASTPSSTVAQEPFRAKRADSRPRSCETCHKRKIRCDRRSPCSNCVRSRVSCVYPVMPENDTPSSEGEVLSRLDKLEDLVANLRGHMPRHPRRLSQPYSQLLRRQDGNSRYVHHAFWQKVNNQIEQLGGLTLDEEETLENTAASPIDSSQNFLFGSPVPDSNLAPYHPLPSQIPFLWKIFKERVDPTMKLYHIPTLAVIVGKATEDVTSLNAASESTVLLVYYAAITSLTEEEVLYHMGLPRIDLLRRYRFALEQSFAKAQFLVTPNIFVFCSFMLFLVLLRMNGDFRISSSMLGLAVRMSQSLGLHRDGSQLAGLTVFKAELRRRAFWALVVLDQRSSDDMGMDPMMPEGSYDTKLPLNVNDADLTGDMKQPPPARTGITDNTMALIRIELHVAAISVQRLVANNTKLSLSELEAKCDETWKKTYDEIQTKYLIPGALDDRAWVFDTMSRVTIAKLRLIARCAMPDQDSSRSMDRLVSTTEILEFNHMANSDERCSKWRWSFAAYTRWQGASYLLTELLRREWSPMIERAWVALSDIIKDSSLRELETATEGSVMLVSFRKLCSLAAKHRQTELARLRADPEAARRLLGEAQLKSDLTFMYIPSRGEAHAVTERWRQAAGLDKGEPEQQPIDSFGTTGAALDTPVPDMTQQSAETNSMESWDWGMSMDGIEQQLSPSDLVAQFGAGGASFALGDLF